MNKRGFEMAISTLVVIVLAIMVLVALALAFTGSFDKFVSYIRGFSGSDINNQQKLCQSQCDLNSVQDFCCQEKTISKEKVTCQDKRLDIGCIINCEGVC